MDELGFRRRMSMELLEQVERASGGDPALMAENSSKLLVKGNQWAAEGACDRDEWLEAMTTLGAAIIESLAVWRGEGIDEVLEGMAEWIADTSALEEEADEEREERIRDEADLKAFELSVGRDLMQLPLVSE